MESQSHTEVIKAGIDTCFDAIVDFQRYPEWFSAISAASVVASNPSAGTWTIEYTLNMIVRTISYTLAYESTRPNLLTWQSVAGDIRAVKGTYDFVALEPRLTEATCTQSVDIGFWVPAALKRGFEKTAIVDSVREFKTAAEQHREGYLLEI